MKKFGLGPLFAIFTATALYCRRLPVDGVLGALISFVEFLVFFFLLLGLAWEIGEKIESKARPASFPIIAVAALALAFLASLI